ncbi:tetratricopeptide repeat protein [Psychrosphaera ytuae]|uniref:Tetratricopeptide repeat protein n=1 Tax=Psychrosphaera ytuae TaxID=2820710 RepID=A0A975D919_9GAMM|nr:tetratricopeptide repeat protein [Psychrosphaera ytuae]QTH62747.1 tetratricopeptide repeat protein [Psychrosphaera ytuae]
MRQLILFLSFILLLPQSLNAMDEDDSQPATSNINLVSAITKFTNERWQESQTEFEYLLSKTPYDATVNFYLGRLSAKQKNFELAERYFVRAVEVEAENNDYLVALADNYLQLAEQVSIFSKMSVTSKARDVLMRSHKLNPEHPDTLYALGHFFHSAPRLLGGDQDKAIAHLTKLTELSPDYVKAYDSLGYCFLEKAQPADAIKAFNQALLIEPNLISAKQGLKVAEQKLSQF